MTASTFEENARFRAWATRAAAGDKPVDLLRPAAWEVIGLACLVIYYLIVSETLESDALDVACLIGSAVFAAILFAAAWRMAALDAKALWLGVFWLRLASGVYFGVGFMDSLLFSDDTKEQARAFFWVQPDVQARTNLVVTLAVFTFLAGAIVWSNVFKAEKFDAENANDGDRLLWLCAITFAGFGYFVKYFIVIPYNFGAFGNIVLPGAILTLIYLAPVGLFLLTLWTLRHAPKYTVIGTVLVCTDVVVGVLQFAKGQVILPLIVYILAVLQYKSNARRLIVAATVVFFVFQTVVPMVTFGRSENTLRYGNIAQGNLAERIEIMESYFTEGAKQQADRSDFQGTLARISYGTVAGAAVKLHDSGQPGDSLLTLFYFFIPRAIWPEKPIFDAGGRFNEALTGNATSFSWMGIFVEPYWNLGWIGIPALMLPLSAIYVFLGRMTIRVMTLGKWLQFPAVLVAMVMGFRVDGEIVSDQVVSMVVCMIVWAFATPLDRLVRAFIAKSAQRSAQPSVQN